MISTAFHLHFDLVHCGPLSEEMKRRAARYDWGWLSASTDAMDADGAMDYTAHAALGAEFRALNPKHRTGWYAGSIAHARPMDPAYPWLTADDLLHAPAGDGRPLWGTPQATGLDTKLVDLSSLAVQTKLIEQYLGFLDTYGFRGVLLDSFSPVYYAGLVSSASGYSMSSGCLEGPAHTVAWWEQALGSFGERLRWSLAQRGHQTMVVGIAPAPDPGPWMGPGFTNVVDYASGAMYEMAHRAYGNPVYFAEALSTVKRATDKRRNVFVSATPRMTIDTGDPPQTDSVDLQRFYWAFYLLMQEAPYTTFGYHPFWAYRGWDDAIKPYVFWSEDWERDLGVPLGPCTARTGALGTVWYRAYSRAIVVCNPSLTYQQFATPGRFRIWDPVNGPLLDMTGAGPGFLMNIPGGQGWVLFREAP